MQRRKFIQNTSLVLSAAGIAPLAGASEAQPFDGDSRGGRLVLPMNRNWRFSRSPSEGAHQKSFDDSGFDSVVIPHTTVRLPWHSFDEKEYQFVSVYRRHFRLPAKARGKRVFVDFEGAMTASTVWINGVRLGEYKGGYTPFSFELTPHLDLDGDNVLVLDLDSTERADIPPFGYEIDYLTFGGLYREVALRIVPSTFIENIFVRPNDVLGSAPSVDVNCFLQQGAVAEAGLSLDVELLDGNRSVAKGTVRVGSEPAVQTVHLGGLKHIRLWDLEHPNLYVVRVRLLQGNRVVDEDSRRFGFREATFTDQGFQLNGKVIKLRGLNRHQTFPFVGQAMPARVQRRDAQILRHELKCNIVRTSHYPQSRHFLDACDEIGLLVLEEIPGWQHIGDEAWKLLAIDNVQRMVRRDWNHPAIILWGVRINESKDDHDFYVRTNALARKLDPTRQTGGIRYLRDSELLEDVFTINDFGFPLKPPNHPRYLNTEFVGHTYPTKTIDNVERLREHTLRHARIHDQLASQPQYAGGLGWCAFDYNTHANFGSGDGVCYHGVCDIFREPKPAAGFYRSQCEPADEVVLEPAFHWARGDESVGFSNAVICSNCEHLKVYIDDKLVGEVDPDRSAFPHLRYPPFSINLGDLFHRWGELRIEGYIGGRQVISRRYSDQAADRKFVVRPDDTMLLADGADSTRVVLRVTDEFGAIRPFANDSVQLRIEGPAQIIGDNPFSLIGGTGAVWVRAKEQAGTVRLTAMHPRLGSQSITITVDEVAAETV